MQIVANFTIFSLFKNGKLPAGNFFNIFSSRNFLLRNFLLVNFLLVNLLLVNFLLGNFLQRILFIQPYIAGIFLRSALLTQKHSNLTFDTLYIAIKYKESILFILYNLLCYL